MIHPSDGRTDGQTDGTAIAYTHYSIYAVARKKVHFYCFFAGCLVVFRSTFGVQQVTVAFRAHCGQITK